VRQLDQDWVRNAQTQLEAFDVPLLLSLLYKTVQHDLEDADRDGSYLSIGKNKFRDGRLEWDVTFYNNERYMSNWSSSLKTALINMLLRLQIIEWGKRV